MRMARPLTASLLAAASFALALPAQGQDGWLRDEERYQGKDAAQSKGFAVLQVATTDPDQFMADWEKPGPGVRLVPQDKVGRGRPIVTFILFRGCRPAPAGGCNVTVDFVTTGPSGKIYDETKAAEVWVGKPPPPDRAIQLSVGGLGLAFEEKDPAGAYRVVALVTDHVAGITLKTEKSLTLLAD